jgi:hypothetical protein
MAYLNSANGAKKAPDGAFSLYRPNVPAVVTRTLRSANPEHRIDEVSDTAALPRMSHPGIDIVAECARGRRACRRFALRGIDQRFFGRYRSILIGIGGLVGFGSGAGACLASALRTARFGATGAMRFSGACWRSAC